MIDKKFNKSMNVMKDAKTFSLTREEKEIVMSRIIAFVKENPMKEPSRPVASPYLSVIGRISHTMWRIPAVVALFLLFVSGGTSFAANFTLPGDILYPVKIYFNENLKSLVAFSARADAEVETEHASERLRETEKLALRGEVSAETKAEIGKNFVVHAKKVKKIAKDLEAKGDLNAAAKINSDFESVLQAHTSVIEEIGIKEEIEEVKSDPKDEIKEEVKDEKEKEENPSPETEGQEELETEIDPTETNTEESTTIEVEGETSGGLNSQP